MLQDLTRLPSKTKQTDGQGESNDYSSKCNPLFQDICDFIYIVTLLSFTQSIDNMCNYVVVLYDNEYDVDTVPSLTLLVIRNHID